ncbi:HNH endonuclease [Alcaligenes sp. 1735tsa3]|uniref:HNH endonuclease n=1 Tax=Alcaligenes sp. 1735tsa3 TaxID=2953809 RepID=UPI0020A71096|nr:HNH endonuclease [Alcaligenes sp. 1735tsa3]USY26691.1 HNH endonuclease [Alcaligenes sp. 1735tsa3]
MSKQTFNLVSPLVRRNAAHAIANAPQEELSSEKLRQLVHYDPETGVFTRLVRTSNFINEGDVAGRCNKQGYLSFSVLGKDRLAHRLAWLYVYGQWPSYQVDHINGIRTDNRISNLRDVPTRVNAHNRNDAPKSLSGLRGVSFDSRRGKYRARIMSHGAEVWLGYFDSADLAHSAYVQAKTRLHEGYVA